MLFVCVRVHNGTGFWRLNTDDDDDADDCDALLAGWLLLCCCLRYYFTRFIVLYNVHRICLPASIICAYFSPSLLFPRRYVHIRPEIILRCVCCPDAADGQATA